MNLSEVGKGWRCLTANLSNKFIIRHRKGKWWYVPCLVWTMNKQWHLDPQLDAVVKNRSGCAMNLKQALLIYDTIFNTCLERWITLKYKISTNFWSQSKAQTTSFTCKGSGGMFPSHLLNCRVINSCKHIVDTKSYFFVIKSKYELSVSTTTVPSCEAGT